MERPRVHLDADTSLRALYTALVARSHDVTRTPNAWMPQETCDVDQLLGAAAHGRVLFTFNLARSDSSKLASFLAVQDTPQLAAG